MRPVRQLETILFTALTFIEIRRWYIKMCFAPTGILCLHILYGQCLSDCEAEYKIRDSSLNPIHYGAVSTLSGGGCCLQLPLEASVWLEVVPLCFSLLVFGCVLTFLYREIFHCKQNQKHLLDQRKHI